MNVRAFRPDFELMLVLCILVGPLFAEVPLVTASTLDFMFTAPSPGVAQVIGRFGQSILVGYIFAVPYALLQCLAIGLALSAAALYARSVGGIALLAALVAGLAAGAIVYWLVVVQGHHPAMPAAQYFTPDMLVITHVFLAASCWAMAQSVWRIAD